MRYEWWMVLVAVPVALIGVLDFGRGTTSARAEDDSTAAKADENQRVELGVVDWHRDFDEAKRIAEQTGKPLFVLFTEVPGCSTVRGYGRRVLSKQVVADAIEAEFVPVAIFNNVEGEDREVLKSFGEPTWNNPAVRIIEPDRSALAPRLYGDYSVHATVRTMVSALESADGSVPKYLRVLEREYAAAGRRERAIFGMYCFWSGEAGLGRLDGVLKTRPGFLEGTEVVEVTYDPRRTNLKALARRAKHTGAASSFYARSDEEAEAVRPVFGDATHRTSDAFQYAPDDDNYAIRETAYAELDLTPLQATLVNSAVSAGESPRRILTPRQRRIVSSR